MSPPITETARPTARVLGERVAAENPERAISAEPGEAMATLGARRNARLRCFEFGRFAALDEKRSDDRSDHADEGDEHREDEELDHAVVAGLVGVDDAGGAAPAKAKTRWGAMIEPEYDS